MVKRMASSLAGSAYAKAHDAGGSVHPADDASVRAATAGTSFVGEGSRSRGLPWRRGSQAGLQGGSLHGGSQADPSASRRTRFASLLPGGLQRAGTAVMIR